jgi:3-deoxy-7-phosphoheptulonate synthase
MLVVMEAGATPAQIDRVIETITVLKLTPHPLPGPTRTAIAITGNTGAVDSRVLEVLEGVKECIRVTKPFKLASREMHPADTVIDLPQGKIGPGTFTVIAGPCSVENEAMILKTAEFLVANGIKFLRAGAFKPRTSPYAFQGMGLEGLKVLQKAREKTGIAIVTELMDTEHAAAVEEAVDVIQIGTRNMQNFSLLKRVSQTRKPVLLKRGMSATVKDLLMSAEYVLAEGNPWVVLCERGVRSFEDSTRNTLDLSAVPNVKGQSHLPIIVDPSHATGRPDLIPSMAMAAVAAKADGVHIEVHDCPEKALSDGPQALLPDQYASLMADLRKLAEVLRRTIDR